VEQFRQLFRQTIAETVDAAGEVDAAMRHSAAVLSRAWALARCNNGRRFFIYSVMNSILARNQLRWAGSQSSQSLRTRPTAVVGNGFATTTFNLDWERGGRNENVPWVFAGCVVIRDEMASNHEIDFL